MKNTTIPSGLYTVRIIYAAIAGLLIGIYIVARITVIGSDLGFIPPSQTEEALPGMFYSGLGTATLADLPDGVLARAGDTKITDVDLGISHIKDYEMLKRLRSRLPMMLESRVLQKIEIQEARAWAAVNGLDPNTPLDMLHHAYFQHLYATVNVNGIEMIKALHRTQSTTNSSNIADRIIEANDYVYEKKKSRLLVDYFHLLGQRTHVELNRKWAQSVYSDLINRPEIRQIDTARRSGKPSVVIFAMPNKTMDPVTGIMDAVKRQFGSRVNVVSTSLGLEPITAGRYGITKLFTVVIYDKQGSEFIRYGKYAMPQLLNAVDAAMLSR